MWVRCSEVCVWRVPLAGPWSQLGLLARLCVHADSWVVAVVGQGCRLGSKSAQGTGQAPWLWKTRGYTCWGRAAGFALCQSGAVGWALWLPVFSAMLAGWMGLEPMLNSWAGLPICFPALAT